MLLKPSGSYQGRASAVPIRRNNKSGFSRCDSVQKRAAEAGGKSRCIDGIAEAKP